MKQIIFILLITTIFGASVFAQKTKPKATALPAGIASLNGEDSTEILDNPAIQKRLKNLLGEKNYADFSENWETLNPIVRQGDFLFSSGCIIHACLHAESSVAIDLKNNIVHAAIYTETLKIRFFNERKSKTPEPIAFWARRFKSVKH